MTNENTAPKVFDSRHVGLPFFKGGVKTFGWNQNLFVPGEFSVALRLGWKFGRAFNMKFRRHLDLEGLFSFFSHAKNERQSNASCGEPEGLAVTARVHCSSHRSSQAMKN